MEVPFDVEQAFGSKKPKVKATIEGVPYQALGSNGYGMSRVDHPQGHP